MELFEKSTKRAEWLVWIDWRRFSWGIDLYVGESFISFGLRLGPLAFDCDIWRKPR
jgi:hypothetical protein